MGKEFKTVKIGLLGFGVVGQGVWKNIEQNRSALEARLGVALKIVKIVVRDLNRERSVSVPESILTSEANDLLEELQCPPDYIAGILKSIASDFESKEKKDA